MPSFPKFRPLNVKDKLLIAKMTNSWPPSADYNFTSLWSYNTNEDIIISTLHGNLIVRFRDYISHAPFYSFYGQHYPLETISSLLSLSQEEGLSPSIKLIPEFCLEEFRRKIVDDGRFSINEDRDNFDYIYSVESLSSLRGVKYEKKRYWANRFLKEFPDYTVRELNLQTKAEQKHIGTVFDNWVKSRKKKSEDTEHDLLVIKRFLYSITHFNVLTIGIYIDSKIVGFSVTELLPCDYAICHFVKGDTTFKGVFETIYKDTAIILEEKGVKFLNRENDLGIEGLRNAKMAWKPISFLKKYTIKPKTSTPLKKKKP